MTRARWLSALAATVCAAAACVGRGPAPERAGGFEEVAAAVGVRVTHTSGATGRKWYPETFGSGVCVTDLDGDDRPDLIFVTGRSWDGEATGAGVAVFRNRGDGTFADVTAASGIRYPFYGMGCAAADYDNDGRDDLLVTGYGGTGLFRNLGGGRFEDVTARAGVADTGWSTCAVWFDADVDGFLDLFLCRYVQWSPETDLTCRLDPQTKVFCGPDPYPPSVSRFFHSLGDGTFQDVTESAGLAKPGKALGAALLDADGDGRADLFVANDQVPNSLFRSRGDGTFVDESSAMVLTPGRFGMARAGMGVDVNDEAGGGIVIGHFSGEGLGFLQRDGDGRWRDRARAAGLFDASVPVLTFGVLFADVDLDGRLDLVVANGHVDANLARSLDGDVGAEERPLLFRGRGDGTYVDDGATMGLTARFVGRGVAAADLDLDGDPDLVFTENNGPARIYRNHASRAHWLGIRLTGTTSNRDGIGAMVTVTAGGRTQTRMVRTGSSYLSQSERALLFGLGPAASVEQIVIRWPSGIIDRLSSVAVDQRVTVVEGGGL
jgi:hypothetical protein